MAPREYFLFCIGRGSLDNWDVCKEQRLFGVPARLVDAQAVKPGDKWVLYLAGQGFKAHGEITSEARLFDREAETPWSDGRAYPVRFSIRVTAEYSRPKPYPFPGNWNEDIQIHVLKHLRRSFSRIERWQYERIVSDLEDLNRLALVREVRHIEPSPEESAHDVAQLLLIRLGHAVGCDPMVSKDTRGRSCRGESFRELSLDRLPAIGLGHEAVSLMERIDVLWLHGNLVVCAFEVEHSTPIYSGLLRLADLVALVPNIRTRLFIVADESRKRKVARELNRPTFTRLPTPLTDVCKFISYQALEDTVERARSFSGYLGYDVVDSIGQEVVGE
jgi:hypothetical protein